MARILAVDDELAILDVIRTVLESVGHEVVTELEAEKAKTLAVEGDFELMISDLRMKPVSGMELLRHVNEANPGITVILLTAYGQVETAVEAMELGAFDYIAKPFRTDHFLDTVQKALDSRNLEAGNVPYSEG